VTLRTNDAGDAFLFVDRRTFELMTAPDTGRLQALIDINRHIAAGLASRTA
jgi:hypothetical protein